VNVMAAGQGCSTSRRTEEVLHRVWRGRLYVQWVGGGEEGSAAGLILLTIY